MISNPPGSSAWGAITGTLADQLDLVAALDAKAGLGANTFTRKQTITQGTTNEGVIASTGYSLTGANATPMIDLAGTWDTSGTPSLFKARITNTASNAASLLLDFGTVADGYMFRVRKDGCTIFGPNSYAGYITDGNGGVSIGRLDDGTSAPSVFCGDAGQSQGAGIALRSNGSIGFSNQNSTISSTCDTFLKRTSIAAIQMGVDSATPIAQLFGACNGVGTDIAGASFTIKAGNGTGSGGSGSLLFQTAPAAGSSSTPNTLATVLTLKASGVVNIANIPASSAGLVTGDLYSTAGALMIV